LSATTSDNAGSAAGHRCDAPPETPPSPEPPPNGAANWRAPLRQLTPRPTSLNLIGPRLPQPLDIRDRGQQVVSPYERGIPRFTATTAIFHHMSVDGVSDLDLSYTPPLGSLWEAIQMGTQVWTRETGRQ
jgi:hypothetical protein